MVSSGPPLWYKKMTEVLQLFLLAVLQQFSIFHASIGLQTQSLMTTFQQVAYCLRAAKIQLQACQS
jgi:hypothetical protein